MMFSKEFEITTLLMVLLGIDICPTLEDIEGE